MDRYLGGEEIDVKVLIADLETAVAGARLFPVIPGCTALRRRHRRAAGGPDPGVPRPGRAPAAAGLHDRGRPRRRRRLRPRRAAARRGGQDHHRPVPRPGLAGTRLLRHAARRHGRARVRPLVAVPRRRGRRPRRGTHETAHADHDEDEKVGALASPLGKTLRPVAVLRGRRPVRGREADPGRDRRHHLGQGPATADGAVVDARPAVPGRGRGARQGRRGQAVARADPAGGRGPDAAHRAQPRHPPAGAVDAWARRTPTCCWSGCGCRYGVTVDRVDVKVPLRETFGRPGAGQGPPRQAVRRPRPVRGVRHRGRAAAQRQRVRVRRQGRRRVGAAPVHPAASRRA